MILGAIVFVWVKPQLPFIIKVACSCFLALCLFIASTLCYNAFINFRIAPLPYPSVEMGTDKERKDSKAYFEVLLAEDLNPQAFVSSVQNIIDSPSLILPFDNPELMLTQGFRTGDFLPLERACLYQPVLGNLKEQLYLELELAIDDLNAGRVQEAQERVHLSLALGNRYLGSRQYLPSLMGLHVCGRVIELVEEYPILAQSEKIQSELVLTTGAEDFLQRSVLHDLKVLTVMLDSGFSRKASGLFDSPISVSNFFNRGYLNDCYIVLQESGSLSEKFKKLEDLKSKSIYTLQIPTYYTLRFIDADVYLVPLNDSIELGKKASEILSLN
jgi:hypothetical protein